MWKTVRDFPQMCHQPPSSRKELTGRNHHNVSITEILKKRPTVGAVIIRNTAEIIRCHRDFVFTARPFVRRKALGRRSQLAPVCRRLFPHPRPRH